MPLGTAGDGEDEALRLVAELVLDRSGTGVALLDEHLRFAYVNEVAAGINGRPAADHLGRSLLEVLPEVGPAQAEVIRRVLDDGEPVLNLEVRGSVPSTPGAVRWWLASYLPLMVHDRPMVLVVFVEVTDQRVAEARLRQLIDSLFTFVGLCDPDGTLREANATALTAAGLLPEDVLDRPFWEAYWWSYDHQVQDRLRHAIDEARAGRGSRYDVPVRVAGGRLLPIDFQIMPVVENDRVVALVPSALDISDRVEQERRLAGLTALSAHLNGATTTTQVIDTLAGGLVEVLDSALVVVGVYEPDTHLLRMVLPSGAPAPVRTRWEHLGVQSPTPFGEAWRTGAPVYLWDREERTARFPSIAPDADEMDLRASAALPLLDENGVFAVLGVAWADEPPDRQELRQRMEIVANMTSQALRRSLRNDSAERLTRMLADELLVRHDKVEDLEIAVTYVPAQDDPGFGGDWYDVIELSPTTTALIVGDVAGHRIEAAAQMALAKSTVRTAVLADPTLQNVHRLAERSLGQGGAGFLATAAVVVVDTAKRQLTHVSFGHLPPVLTVDGETTLLWAPPHPPLGVPAEPATVGTYRWNGDEVGLLLYSDGLVETRTDAIDDRMEALRSLVAELGPAPRPVDVVEHAIDTMTRTGRREDDMVVLAARRRPLTR